MQKLYTIQSLLKKAKNVKNNQQQERSMSDVVLAFELTPTSDEALRRIDALLV